MSYDGESSVTCRIIASKSDITYIFYRFLLGLKNVTEHWAIELQRRFFSVYGINDIAALSI